MADYAAMSDDDLMSLVKPKDYSAMSDADLMKLVGSQALDVGKSAGVGVAKGAIGMAGLPGTIQSLSDSKYNPFKIAADKFSEAYPERTAKNLKNAERAGLGEGVTGETRLPSASDIQGQVEGLTGKFYEPRTRLGRYAETTGEMAAGALAGPGGIARKAITQALIPGVGSEYAGEQTKGTPYEPYARVAGALLGVGTGAGVNAGITGVQNRIAAGRTSGELSDIIGAPVSAGATRRLAGSVEADNLTPQAAGTKAAELGPDAMLMDAGRQLRGRAEAVAAQPGRGQNTVLDAVEQRTGRFGENTAARVEQTLNKEMGQTHDVVQLQQRVEDAVNKIAVPLYEKVMGQHEIVAVPTAITERPAVAQAMKDAVSLAKNRGEQLEAKSTSTILSGPGYHIADDVVTKAKPSLRYFDYVKKALDARINGMMKSGGIQDLNSAEKADLGGLMDARKALVSHLDEVTGGAYAEARKAMATKYELKEALEVGRSAFNTKLLPEEFSDVLANMSIPERAMAQAGFRRELDRIIGATRNEGATARRILDTNHVLQKAEMLYGPQAVKAIEQRIGAENTFQEATQDIARNSRTAVRQQLIKDTSTPSSNEIRGVSIPGLMWSAGRGGMNYIRQHGMDTTRGQIADVLTAPSHQVQPIIGALTGLNARRSVPRGGSPSRAAIVDALLAGQH